MRPPAEACAPFKEPRCSDAEPATSAGGRPLSGGLDPGTAKRIKGLTWGAFAASAATGITLFALSGTGVGTHTDPSGFAIANNLDGPAITMLGVSGALLAISIPITVAVNRATTRRAGISSDGGEFSLVCPH